MINAIPCHALARLYRSLKTFASICAVIATLFGLTDPLVAANKYWVGASGNTNNPTSGTWATTNPIVWSDGAVATADAGWSAGDTAYFGGANGTYNVQVAGPISMTAMNFLASGYTLTNSTPETITASAASGFITVAPGTTNTIGKNVTVTIGSSSPAAIGAAAATAGGTLIIDNGAIVQQTVNRGLNVSGAAGTVVSVGAGGLLAQANIQAGSSYLMVGYKVGDAPTLSVDGGTVSVARSTQSIDVPAPSGVASFGDVEGTLTVNSGSVLPGTAGGIVLAQEPSNTGTLNLNGGVITAAAGVTKGGTALGDSTGIAHFNGGTLEATINQPAFIDGLDWADIRNGGLVVDNRGFNLTVGQSLVHSTNVLDNAIDGGVISLGTGTLTLLPDNSGVNTYTGPTTVSNGTVVITTANIGGGSCFVNDGAALTVQVNNGGTSLTNSSLTLGSSGSLVENFALGGNASETVPAVTVNGALNLNGTVTVNVTGSLIGPSTNLLMSYGSIGGSGSFVIGVVPSVSGYVGALINDTVNKQLKLIYYLPGTSVQWAVGNGNWDTSSPNWQPLGGGSATNFQESDPVTFDDNATGSSPITVTLTGDHSVGDINVNATKEYIITGGGFAITAGGALNKNNSGELIWAVNSSYVDGTFINTGVLQVGNGGTQGSLGPGNIADNTALVFNSAGNVNVPGAISGSGSITNIGGGTVNLTGSNSYTGITVINAGKLTTTLASTGAGDFVVATGATLGIQANSTGSLHINNLTLGTTSGNLTNSFVLGTLTSTTNPLVTANVLNLNGTVTVNASGTGLSSGTYVLLQYSSLTGSGSFVTGTMPQGGWTVVNDTIAKQVKLVGVSGLVWDAGNTNNGATIDAGSGTWDLNAGNTVWNNNGINVGFNNGNSVVFGGANGSYNINLGASVTTPALLFQNSGYTLSATNPQTIGMSGATGALQLFLDPGTTNTIGTNVTIQTSASLSYEVGQIGSTPGGTLNIISGGSVVQNNDGRTLAADGYDTVINVYNGGSFSQSDTNTGNDQLVIGLNVGASSFVNVEGGAVTNGGTASGSIVTLGSAGSGTLTVDSGTVSSVSTSGGLRLAANPGASGTVNLNGGTMSVPIVFKGTNNNTATATFNFNGGTLRANTNNTSFMTGLDAANVLTNGAVIDDGGNAITIGQSLLSGSSPDGGLTKLGAGIVTLSATNTYTGTTTISNGTLALTTSGAVIDSRIIEIAGGATFDVSAVSPWDLEANQTLTGSGTVNGSMQANGTVWPVGTLTFNDALTVNGNLVFTLNKSMAQSNAFVAVNGTLDNTGTGTLTVTNLGPALAVGDKFTLFSQSMPNGQNLTIVPPSGVTFTNNLNVDGSISVLTAPFTTASNPTNITLFVSGKTLNLSWPEDHIGWIMQSNGLSLLNTNDWFDIPNSQNGTNLIITINPALNNVFYRLRHP